MQLLTPQTSRSREVISLLNASGRLLYASASAAEVFGFLPDEIIGLNFSDLFHPDDRLPSVRALSGALTLPPGASHVTVRVRGKEGEWCWVESSFSSVRHEKNLGAIVVRSREVDPGSPARSHTLQDPGDSIRPDTRLEEFANAVAHDLREPLRSISAYTELLVWDKKLDDESQVHARFIIEGVARMSALLEGLRAFALSGNEEPAHVLNMETVVGDVLLNLGHAIRGSNAIVTVGPLPSVYGSPEHLQRVLQNLIANGIKYRSRAPVKIHVSAERLGADWMIRIRDNGIGIAPEYHEQIFVLFQRLHGPEIPGAGIGLSICTKLIQAMGGAIWVESEVGSGSSFCFTIPAAGPAAVELAGRNRA